MNGRVLMIVSLCVAVIAAAVAASVVSLKRADAARFMAEAASAKADEALALKRAEEAKATAESEKRRAAEADAKAKENALAAQKLATEEAAKDAKAEADRRATAEAETETAHSKEEAAIALRDAEQAKVAQARALVEQTNATARIAIAKADTAADNLAAEKVKAEKVADEKKLLELRKIDFALMEQQLMEWKLDLDEREKALRPEKTIADLSWAGGMEDSVMDEKGNIRKQEKKVYDPEKDMKIPAPSRKLAKSNRMMKEAFTNDVDKLRSSVVRSMERLYINALKEDRVVDADFYKKTILSMYPDWKFKGED